MKTNSQTGKLYDFYGPGSTETSDQLVKMPITEIQTYPFAAAVELKPYFKKTIANVSVEEAMALTADLSDALLGDELVVKLANDGTQRTVTPGAGLKASGNIVGTVDETIIVTFVHDGTNFVEQCRSAAIDFS